MKDVIRVKFICFNCVKVLELVGSKVRYYASPYYLIGRDISLNQEVYFCLDCGESTRKKK